MNTARIVVLTIAVGAGGVAAYLASGSDNKSAPAEPVAQLQTVDVLVAKSDIGLGQTVTPEDLQWQTWPAATASNNFIRRNERPEATTEIAGSIARAPFIAGEPIREPKLVKANGSGFMAAILPTGMRADLDRNLAGNRRRRLHPAQRPRRRHSLQAREESGRSRRARCRQLGNHPVQRSRARDRSGAEGKRRPERRGRQDRHARAEARAGGDARPRAPDRHAGAGAAQHRRRQHGREQTDDQAPKRGESVNVVRYGVPSSTTTQK